MSTVREAVSNAHASKVELPDGWGKPPTDWLPRPAFPPRVDRPDRYRRFYRSAAWRAARYKFMAGQPKPLRCAACGATARETRLAVDHIEPIKKNWERRLDQMNLQILCGDNSGCAANLAKGSHDQTDFRDSPRP